MPKQSMVERAKVERAGIRTIDAAKGRRFNPLTPNADPFARLIITEYIAVNPATGEERLEYHVDTFNTVGPRAAAVLYARGAEAVMQLVLDGDLPAEGRDG